jgi:hypothetical protein
VAGSYNRRQQNTPPFTSARRLGRTGQGDGSSTSGRHPKAGTSSRPQHSPKPTKGPGSSQPIHQKETLVRLIVPKGYGRRPSNVVILGPHGQPISSKPTQSLRTPDREIEGGGVSRESSAMTAPPRHSPQPPTASKSSPQRLLPVKATEEDASRGTSAPRAVASGPSVPIPSHRLGNTPSGDQPWKYPTRAFLTIFASPPQKIEAPI